MKVYQERSDLGDDFQSNSESELSYNGHRGSPLGEFLHWIPPLAKF